MASQCICAGAVEIVGPHLRCTLPLISWSCWGQLLSPTMCRIQTLSMSFVVLLTPVTFVQQNLFATSFRHVTLSGAERHRRKPWKTRHSASFQAGESKLSFYHSSFSINWSSWEFLPVFAAHLVHKQSLYSLIKP